MISDKKLPLSIEDKKRIKKRLKEKKVWVLEKSRFNIVLG